MQMINKEQNSSVPGNEIHSTTLSSWRKKFQGKERCSRLLPFQDSVYEWHISFQFSIDTARGRTWSRCHRRTVRRTGVVCTVGFWNHFLWCNQIVFSWLGRVSILTGNRILVCETIGNRADFWHDGKWCFINSCSHQYCGKKDICFEISDLISNKNINTVNYFIKI